MAVKKAPVLIIASVIETFDTLIAPKNVSQCTAMIMPAMEKERKAFRESEISIFFHLIYAYINREAMPIRNHTNGTESILMREPSTAVNPHINTMK